MNKIISLSLAVLLLSGCTTLADARLAKGTGTKQTFESPFDDTWDAVICSLNGRGLSIADENKPKGYILAQRGITAFSYGENVAVFVRKQTQKRTVVEVVSKRAMETNIFAPDWAGEVLSGINGCLD
jgi:hypothetical protein